MRSRIMLKQRSVAFRVFATTALGVLLLPAFALAEDGSKGGAPGATITVKGTSTLHDWEMESKKIVADVHFGSAVASLDALKQIPEKNPLSLTVKIPVASLKSGKEDMDEKAYESLKSEQAPEISFALKSISPNLEKSGANAIHFDAQGTLSIAGVQKDVTLDAEVGLTPEGKLSVSTKKQLKMSEFQMEIPSAMMGMVTAGDEVEVDIDWVLAAS